MMLIWSYWCGKVYQLPVLILLYCSQDRRCWSDHIHVVRCTGYLFWYCCTVDRTDDVDLIIFMRQCPLIHVNYVVCVVYPKSEKKNISVADYSVRSQFCSVRSQFCSVRCPEQSFLLHRVPSPPTGCWGVKVYTNTWADCTECTVSLPLPR
jgi:hypothetical protein